MDDAGGSAADVVRSQSLSSRARLALAAILLAGLGLRLWHLYALSADILFDHPQLDEEIYVAQGRTLAAGQIYDANPYWQPPGLIYALCVVFRFAGRGLMAPRVVQALLSTACALLAFLLARRWFSIRIALAAAAVVAFHGVLVFESAELLPATWIAFFDLVMLLLLLRAADSGSIAWAAAAGIALGVCALFAPTVLPFGAVAAIGLRRRIAAAAVFCAGAALVVAPVALRNHRNGGEWVLVSTNGGINFYIGNNEGYPDTVAVRPGRHWTELWTEPNRAGILRPGAASHYFTAKAMRFVRAHPLREAGLLLRKLYLYADGAEIPRDTDIYAARAQSPPLRALVWPGPLHVPDGILIPLALVGLVLAWRRELWAPIGFVIASAAVTAAFFVTSRHRMPALPVLAMFAVVGAAEIARSIGRRRGALAAAAVAVMIVLFNLPTRETAQSYAAELDFYRGLAFLRDRHDAARAVGFLRQAAQADPNDERFWFELGNARETTGDVTGAIDAWSRSAALDPTDSRPSRRIAYWRGRQGDLDGAIAALEADLPRRTGDEAARERVDLGMLRVGKRDYHTAVEDFRLAAQAGPAAWRSSAEHVATTLLADPSIRDEAFWRELGDLLELGGQPLAADQARQRAHTMNSHR